MVLALAAVACDTAATTDRADQTATSLTAADVKTGNAAVTVAAAGDIAGAPEDGRGTADLIEAFGPDAVLALGDNAYSAGSISQYQENYEPTWGAFKDITRPAPGNHEYRTEGAAGYFEYFREQIHDQPYYSWDAGPWRMYSLNCEIDCGRGSKQLDWLKEDLAASADRPALAYVHQPFYTCSTKHPPFGQLDGIWEALQEGSGQLLLSAHNHAYERFAQLDSQGNPSADGLRQFVVGSGGVSVYPLESRCANREAQTETSGVLTLELRGDSYAWEFVDIRGEVLDSGEQPIS